MGKAAERTHLLGELVGCAKRKGRPSEVNPTAARYREWERGQAEYAARVGRTE